MEHGNIAKKKPKEMQNIPLVLNRSTCKYDILPAIQTNQDDDAHTHTQMIIFPKIQNRSVISCKEVNKANPGTLNTNPKCINCA